MKNDCKSKERAEILKKVAYKMERWNRMEREDVKALFEIMIEKGWATKE